MPDISNQHERSTEENLFCLDLPNRVSAPVLVRIASIPLETLKTGHELVEKSHGFCI